MTRSVISRDWIQRRTEEYFGFRLELFQLDIAEAVLNGGTYSVMLPTDHGKTTLIRVCVFLKLLWQAEHGLQLGNHFIIKAGDIGAAEMQEVIYHLLQRAAVKYPVLKVEGRHGKAGLRCVGADELNPNPTLFCASIGARENQGRRGATYIDDVETMNEAVYEKFRQRNEARVMASLRSLEDRPDALWSLWGTPYADDSIYFKINKHLDGDPTARIFRFPVADENGNLLWPARRAKIEKHRRMMSHAEWQVAYELRPISSRPIDEELIVQAQDANLPYMRTESELVRYVQSITPTPARPDRSLAPALPLRQRIVLVPRLYIGWDPSEGGDFAMAVVLYLGSHLYVIDTYLQAGDSLEQMGLLAGLIERYPTATVVIENNNVQRVFARLTEERFPNTLVIAPRTDANIRSAAVGIPVMLDLLRSQQFHLPWADNQAQQVSYPVIEEMKAYSPSAHPHLLPAIWFTHYYDQRNAMKQTVEKVAPPKTDEVEYHKVVYSERAQKAWGKKRVRW